MDLKDWFVLAAIVLHGIMALLGALGMYAIVRAYRFPLTSESFSDVWFFAKSIIALAISVGFAILAISLWVPWAVYMAASPMMLETGWPLIVIGLIYDMLFLRGIYMGLKAIEKSLHLSINESEWASWPWWRAWMHPHTHFMFWLWKAQ